jgi:hypothetical protein
MVVISWSIKEIKVTQFEHQGRKKLRGMVLVPLVMMKPWNGDAWKFLALKPKEEWNNIDFNPKMECKKIVTKPKKGEDSKAIGNWKLLVETS